jgi:hypothetical protein
MKRSILTLCLAAMAAAASAPARAGLPEEGWWRVGEATLGLHVEGRAFCGISAAPQGVWVLRGRVVDGRLVETSRHVARPGASARAAGEPPDDTDYFVQTTAVVRRDRSAERPRGEFAVFEPLPAAPTSTLWLDMVWGCSRETELEKLAESPRSEGDGR